MITVEVLAVEQKFDFATKGVRNHIILKIGDKLVRAEVPNIDEVATVIEAGLAAGSGEPAPEVQEPPTTSADTGQSSEGVQEDQDPVVAWEHLPDDILPARVKKAMSHLGCPPQMLASKVDTLAQSIEEELEPEEWEMLAPQDAPPWAPPQDSTVVRAPEPAPRPAPPAVTWANAQPMLPTQGRAARVVQKDEHGYPIVADAGVSTARVVGAATGARDESGVGQF